MREYKFRGKIIDSCGFDGQWMHGSLRVSPNHMHIQKFEEVDDRHGKKWQWWSEKVDPETVGQYTGFKDMAGDEIYENSELVRINQLGKVYELTTVKYNQESGRWVVMYDGHIWNNLTAENSSNYKVFS